MKFAMLRATKLMWSRFGWLLMLILGVSCGCSGINASKSISPLDFLLPGLHMENDPPKPLIPATTNVLVCWHDGVLAAATR
jgi:hypothetical protein